MPLRAGGDEGAELAGGGEGGLGSGLWVFEDFAFVVADEDALFIADEDVVGIQRHFSATAWGINDELRHGITGGVTPESFDDFDPLCHGGTEVGGALDQIALIQVVGPDAAHEELVNEALHDFWFIVHAAQEHALIPQWHAVVCEDAEAFADLGGEFAGMIGVDADEKRVVLLQHAAQLWGDPLWKENGHAGADAEELDVRDLAQSGEDGVELGVRKKQGIPAGEQDIAHFRVLFEVAEGGLELGVQFLFADAADDSAAGAVAAVGGAAICDEEEDAVWVAVDETWHGHVAIFAARVCHFVGVIPGFLNAGDHLPADGAGGIISFDEIKIMGRDGHGQLVAGEENASAFFIGEDEVTLQLGERGDSMAELPLGVLPIRLADVLVFPIPRCKGSELLFRESEGVGHRALEMCGEDVGVVRVLCQSGSRKMWRKCAWFFLDRRQVRTNLRVSMASLFKIRLLLSLRLTQG